MPVRQEDCQSFDYPEHAFSILPPLVPLKFLFLGMGRVSIRYLWLGVDEGKEQDCKHLAELVSKPKQPSLGRLERLGFLTSPGSPTDTRRKESYREMLEYGRMMEDAFAQPRLEEIVDFVIRTEY